MSYDIETLLDDIKTTMTTHLGTKLTAINSEKNDGITLTDIDQTDGYFFQSLNGATINTDPFILYTIENIESESMHGATSVKADIAVVLVKEDKGEEVDISRRMLRYGRALKEIFEKNFEVTNGGVKLVVQSLVPVDFQLLNSSNLHKAIGVLIKASFA